MPGHTQLDPLPTITDRQGLGGSPLDQVGGRLCDVFGEPLGRVVGWINGGAFHHDDGQRPTCYERAWHSELDTRLPSTKGER